ncbi:MAG: DUF1801 domain-containing protein [Arcanobacterium sp.]|nr:DUF1801 domain-containing protein [Arcanobacterium sp.]
MPIQTYIKQQNVENQPRLNLVYETIRNLIPEAEERISWGMPTFWQGRNIIHFANAKNHLGIYPGPRAVEEFLPKLTAYKTSKGAIQLPHSADLPLELISEITLWCYENYRK